MTTIELKSSATQTAKAHPRLSLRLTARACALGVKRGRQAAWKAAAEVISAVRAHAAMSEVSEKKVTEASGLRAAAAAGEVTGTQGASIPGACRTCE